jgi:hypothetical protein
VQPPHCPKCSHGAAPPPPPPLMLSDDPNKRPAETGGPQLHASGEGLVYYAHGKSLSTVQQMEVWKRTFHLVYVRLERGHLVRLHKPPLDAVHPCNQPLLCGVVSE